MYRAAGVDLEAARSVKDRIRDLVAPTHNPAVLGGVGGFGALYELTGYREPVLVSSTDGVGTKVRLAVAMDRYDTVGEDVVNACINDVIVTGAKPLFFLDYIGAARLVPGRVEELLRGMARACSQAGCALVGGETAQMPGLYTGDDFDLVGFAVGVVEKDAILNGANVVEGDALLGIPSSGLHTNGYSLVRRVFDLDRDPSALRSYYPELGSTLGEILLTPHRSYYPVVRPAVPMLKSMAHITGGGLIENVPRVLPDGLGATFDRTAWAVPPVFSLIQARGQVATGEMYRVFNMGLGMVLVCSPACVDQVVAAVPEARLVGEVVRAGDGPRVIV